jgi:hypothetical protein
MHEILGTAKTVRALLKGVKYSIDDYQREYKWQKKQVMELLDDLNEKFLESYDPSHSRKQVKEYGHYFLGSIIISKKDISSYIVDGQQRLSSLTLLLIFLRNLQSRRADTVNVDELIFSEQYGEKSFNLDVPERLGVMRALFEGQPFDFTDRSESEGNLWERYRDIETAFPTELREQALPYFIDWLLENVHIVEITAYSDDDAYTIFETMNDRGLSLSPTEMLKGYLLANIDDAQKRISANNQWRDRVHRLNEAGKEVEPDFFKAWLRSQYASKVRERHKNASPEDFERIGSEFHRWVRDERERIGLKQGADFCRFIESDLNFYTRWYLRLMRASDQLEPGLEAVRYNAQLGFTLQYMLLLAPLRPGDDEAVAFRKIRLVSKFVDILLNWRIWNFRSIAYSTMQYAMFLVMRDIRGMAPEALGPALRAALAKETETFWSNDRLRVHQQNRYPIHRLLARLTDYVEVQSGLPSHYEEYVAEGRSRFEVEHIWADHAEEHADEFTHPADFGEHRNRIGGLLLVPKSFNASYGDLTYQEKLPHYLTQNLLARSLHPQCYQHNPGFLSFIATTNLPFHPCEKFRKPDIEDRSLLYRSIAERVWSPDQLLAEAEQGSAAAAAA